MGWFKHQPQHHHPFTSRYPLRVDYAITKPEDFPYFTYSFANPVDMSNLTVLNIEMMTYNKSQSVVYVPTCSIPMDV